MYTKLHFFLLETITHVLLDSWYSAKRIWKACRDRGFLITTGFEMQPFAALFRAMLLQMLQKGWKWQLHFRLCGLPSGKRLSALQLAENPGASGMGAHCRYTRQVSVSLQTNHHSSQSRRSIEYARYFCAQWPSSWCTKVFGAYKCTLGYRSSFWRCERTFGIDQYQLMTTTALLRYWRMSWIAFSYLEEIRDELKNQEVLENEQGIGEKFGEKDEASCMKIWESFMKLSAKLDVPFSKPIMSFFLEWVYQNAFSGTPVKDLSCLFSRLSSFYDETAKIVIKQQEPEMPHAVFHIIAEDVEEEHIAAYMQPFPRAKIGKWSMWDRLDLACEMRWM